MSPSRTGGSAFWCGPMRVAFGISLLAIALSSLIGASAASAGTLVEFPNLDGHTPANLSGYLARPDAGLSAEIGGHSDGAPYLAVVVLHGCNGMFGNSAVIADRLSSWGYVTLAVARGSAASPTVATKNFPIRRLMPTRRSITCRSSTLSIRLGWPPLATRRVAKPRSMPSWTATSPHNLSKSGFVQRLPITAIATPLGLRWRRLS